MISLDVVSQAHLIEFTRTIAQWTRLSGTPDEREAAAYVEERLRSFRIRGEDRGPRCLHQPAGHRVASPHVA